VGPRAVLDAVVKRKIPSPGRESNPRTPIVQPVAHRLSYLKRNADHYLQVGGGVLAVESFVSPLSRDEVEIAYGACLHASHTS
jgi:hypothetical protein